MRRKLWGLSAAVIIAVAGFAFIRNRKPSVPPSLVPYLNFIRQADDVELIATTRSWNIPDEPGGVFAEMAKEKRGLFHTVKVDKDHREEIVDYLAGLFDAPTAQASCFDPHHFVVAKKGKEVAEIDICLTCKSFECRATNLATVQLPVSNADWKLANRVFGADVDQALRNPGG